MLWDTREKSQRLFVRNWNQFAVRFASFVLLPQERPSLFDLPPHLLFCDRSQPAGPGATHLITPMVDALADGTRPWDNAQLPRCIKQAFEIATSGRSGPVLVELPIDITAVTSLNKNRFSTIKRAADLINIAQKPVLYVGQGILASPRGPQLLNELTGKASIPVTTTLHGLGSFDEEDPKALHILGLHGSGYANRAIQEADMIIAIGARFDDRVTGYVPKFAPKAKEAAYQGRGEIIHFEITPKNINKVVQATEAVVGDCTTNLEILMTFIKWTGRPEWLNEISQWKNR
ncbi:hypothetical protein N7454_009049 [Penicillium verhagenii]|nr:hypothetical protein N7454_009049 [Penicillium verhagenii]